MVNVSGILERLGIYTSNLSVKTIKELDKNKKFFVPYEDIYLIVEPIDQENKNYLFFLNLNSKKHYSNYGSHAKIEIYKESEERYTLIEPIVDINQLLISEKKEFSKEFIEQIIKNLSVDHKKNIKQANPYTYSEKEGKESNEVYEKFFSKNFIILWGTRELKESERARIVLSTGKFEPKKPKTNIEGQTILKKMREKLALQEDVINLLFNKLNFHNILVGKSPINGGLVLYGPGGTGKTTIMGVVAEIFEELGAYVAKNDKNEFLKTSEVKDTKYYGAYTDYFEPKFAKALQEARIRGIPSLIPIDEGDIFVKNSSGKENAHSSDMLNFWKGHVGNHEDFIVIVASNVLKKDLNPIAIRAKRAVSIEIPPPDLKIAKDLILLFIKFYKIKLNEEFTDTELKKLAKIIVDNKKPGANISDFCENFYGKLTDYPTSYQTGKTSDEIEKDENILRNKIISKEDFIKKFEEEVLGFNPKESSSKDLENLILKEENSQFFINLLIQNPPISGVINSIEDEFKFSFILKDFYFKTKSKILLSNKNSGNEKIIYYEFLVSLIKNLPTYFNDENYVNDIKVFKLEKNKLIIFLNNLFNNLIKSEDKNFVKIFEKTLNTSTQSQTNNNSNDVFKTLKDGINILAQFDRENNNNKKLDDTEVQQLFKIIESLNILKNYPNKYLHNIEILKNLISFSIIELNRLERERYFIPQSYTILIRNLQEIVKNKK